MEKLVKERDIALDALKGVGIICVVIGHFISQTEGVIFSFHMPLFFIVAGYLFKPKSLTSSIKGDMRRLILPYYVICLIYLILWTSFDVITSNNNFTQRLIAVAWGSGSNNHTSMYFADIPMLGAIWFLWGLFWCKLFYNAISKIVYNIYYRGLVCASLSTIATIIDISYINLPLAILPGMNALIFYWIGNLIRFRGGFKELTPLKCVICLLLWIISAYNGAISMVRCYYSIWWINIPAAMSAIFIIYHIINKIRMGMALRFLSLCGEISLAILCFHFIDLHFNVIRSVLGIPSGFGSLIFNLIFCTVAVVLASYIPILRNIFGLSTVSKLINLRCHESL